MTILSIGHEIRGDGQKFIVRETFADCTPIEFELPDLETARAFVAERRLMLKEMVAAISPAAREAVEDAVEVDLLKAGHA